MGTEFLGLLSLFFSPEPKLYKLASLGTLFTDFVVCLYLPAERLPLLLLLLLICSICWRSVILTWMLLARLWSWWFCSCCTSCPCTFFISSTSFANYVSLLDYCSSSVWIWLRSISFSFTKAETYSTSAEPLPGLLTYFWDLLLADCKSEMRWRKYLTSPYSDSFLAVNYFISILFYLSL